MVHWSFTPKVSILPGILLANSNSFACSPAQPSMSLTRNELEELSSISIADSIPQAQVDQALQSAPFVNRGVLLNHRDLGLVPGSKIRANTIYRSGGLQTTPEITGWLSDNVTKVFDLRSDPEVNKSPDPQSPSFVNIYYPQGAIGSHLNVKDFTGDGSVAWGRMYITVLQLYVPSLRAILEHVRDSCTPFLFHCAGELGAGEVNSSRARQDWRSCRNAAPHRWDTRG